MNKTAIKNFAVSARVTLIQAVTQKAFEYEVTEGGRNDPMQTSVNGQSLTAVERSQRSQLIAHINANGFEQTMEEAAYTWFNRFIAMRFMEVNNYLPLHTRIFSDEYGNFKPEVLTDAVNLEIEGLDKEFVLKLLENQENERLYQYIIITQCNALYNGLPEMFERIGSWTELLFPKNLLRDDSVIAHMVKDIPEEDWQDQVQIIGWLYQYYNTEPKDKVFADLKKNIKISAESIPAATQLFTPDWIVRYMVENSLGRLWAEGHGKPENADWKYYLEEAEQEDSVKAELEKMRAEYRKIQPEQIKIIDPCMGSGHILVYAFDVLMDIYTSCGWSERDAAKSILQNNLYGLDIDLRAYQLAYFSVMMKARQYNRRILSPDNQPHLANFTNIMGVDANMLSGITQQFVEQFQFANNYGSLMKITASADLDEVVSEFETKIGLSSEQLKMMFRIYKILSQKYDVVCTNPPYMGGSGMNTTLADYVKKNYPDSKSDLFACFMEKGISLTKTNGYNCMVTMQSWMFLSSFEKMREKLLEQYTITNLMHMENMVMGIAFGTAVSIFKTIFLEGYKGTYNQIKLQDVEDGKPTIFPVMRNRFAQVSSVNFSKIPGSPVAYWVSENFVRAFENKNVSDYGFAGIGMRTGDNNRFLRLWYEVNITNLFIGCKSVEEQILSKTRWIPYNKGGEFRRWYGNNDYVVNWYNNGVDIKENTRRVYPQLGDDLGWKISNEQYYYKKGITWSGITSSKCSYRVYEEGFIFDSGANGLFVYDDENRYYLAACLNNNITLYTMSVINPTINNGAGTIRKLPIIIDEEKKPIIDEIVQENINLSKADWDSFETSWDFERHPLINGERTLAKAFEKWEQDCEQRFNTLKANEEELNRIFIEIYGLQDELTPEVEDRDVTVRKADLTRDIKSFISYAVGCMFGRYSLDNDGLAYAGGEWDANKYKTIIPVKDNVLPICDDDYLESDLTGKIVEFVGKVYGEETLEENLKFIARALGTKGDTPREVIRNYLLNGFYADHCKIYQKRPIYWLFNSGKKHGFKALVYMHRWEKTTVATVRTDYVHELQERYRTQLSMLGEQMEQAVQSERVKLKKRQEKLTAQLDEINTYEEKVHHIADSMIDIDLDDGVKVNYAKFADILEKIK